MRIKIEPFELAKSLAAINPLSPGAKAQQRLPVTLVPSARFWRRFLGLGGRQQRLPVTLVLSAEGLTVRSPQWGDPPRPAVATDVPCYTEETGDAAGWGLTDSRQTLKDLRSRFKGLAAKTPALLETDVDGGLLLDDLKISAQPVHPSYLANVGEPDVSVTFPAEKFQNLVSRFLPLVSADASRPRLSCMQLRIRPSRVRFGATDSYVAGVEWLKTARPSEPGERSLERNLLRAAVRHPASGECLVGWSEDGTREYLEIGPLRLCLRRYDRLSPVNLDELLARNSRPGDLTLLRPHDAAQALRAVVRDGEVKDPVVRLDWKGAEIFAALKDGTTVPLAKTRNAGEMSASFNAKFLISMLEACPSNAPVQVAFPVENRSPNSFGCSPLYAKAGTGSQFMLMPVHTGR